MMGHRVKLGSCEQDVLFDRKHYGHKAGGATIYAKRLSARKERRAAKVTIRSGRV